MEKEKVSEHFMRLGMSDRMRQQIEDWRAANRKEDGGIMSFSDAVRTLINQGLSNGDG